MSGESPNIWTALSQMPGAQMLFVALCAGTWLIGGNLVIARHYRRIGQPAWSAFKFGAFPFKNFNAREWLTLFVVAVAALTFGSISLLIGEAP